MLLVALVSLMLAQDMSDEQRAGIAAKGNPEVIRTVQLHPLYDQPYVCAEHWAGQVIFPGDALGQDCMIIGGAGETGFMSPFRGDGKKNEDWYGWGARVYAPISGTVIKVIANPQVNEPGKVGERIASGVMLDSPDGIKVAVVHLGNISVKENDVVAAGDVIGTVGNNGNSRSPHIHVGAFDAASSLQIRWNLKAYAKMFAKEPGKDGKGD